MAVIENINNSAEVHSLERRSNIEDPFFTDYTVPKPTKPKPTKPKPTKAEPTNRTPTTPKRTYTTKKSPSSNGRRKYGMYRWFNIRPMAKEKLDPGVVKDKCKKTFSRCSAAELYNLFFKPNAEHAALVGVKMDVIVGDSVQQQIEKQKKAEEKKRKAEAKKERMKVMERLQKRTQKRLKKETRRTKKFLAPRAAIKTATRTLPPPYVD